MRPFNFFKNLSKNTNSTRRAKARLSIESLEDRLTPTVQVIGSALFVTGTTGNDIIQLTTSSQNGVALSFDNQAFTFAANQIDKVEIDPEQGNNTVNILSTPAGVEVTVDCLQGPDSVTIGNGNLDFLGGNVTVNGDNGANVFVHDQNANVPTNYVLAGGSLSWGGAASISYASCANFDLSGSANSNYIVESTGQVNVTRIDPGQGTNTVFVGEGDLNTIATPLAVFGSSGVNNVIVRDASHSGTASYTITQNAVSRSGFGGLVYGGIASLTLDGTNSGADYAVNSTAFNTTTTIQAGTGVDSIDLGGGQIDELGSPVVVNGDASDSILLDDQSDTLAASYTIGVNTVAPTDFFGGLTYQGVGDLTILGSAGNDDFAVTATPTASVSLMGGSNGNTLTGPDANTSWVINGLNRGRLGTNVFFTNVQVLQGGAANDTFAFSDNFFFHTQGSINNSINGGGGTNVLNYSLLSGPVAVNLATAAASRIRVGNAGGFSRIQQVIGSASASDTLTGPNVYSDWIISRANAGKVGSVVFVSFENLVGGSNVDSFRFLTGGSVSGSVDGGLAPTHQGNWLDYSNLSTAVAVNLQTGAATGVAGGATGKVTHIQNVHAGNGGSTLVGNSQGNILIGGTGNDLIQGGTGRSILIGDAGSDTVTGGSGNDILIGDKTTLDVMTTNNQRALMAIMAEWQSADTYAVRFHDIDTGVGGLNGHNKLNFGTTVLDDGAADSVTGVVTSVGADWFFQGAGDTLHTVQTGEHVNNT